MSRSTRSSAASPAGAAGALKKPFSRQEAPMWSMSIVTQAMPLRAVPLSPRRVEEGRVSVMRIPLSKYTRGRRQNAPGMRRNRAKMLDRNGFG